MKIIGLTSGIGSGKSRVADQLAELGAAIIDTDVIAGMESGLATVLVLSGCTSRTDVNGYPYRPTYILNGVGEIVTG